MWYNNGKEEIILQVNEEIPKGFVKGRLKRMGTREKEIEEFFLNHIPKEFIEYYSNHSAEDTCKHFNFSTRKVIYELCKRYNFKKEKPTMPQEVTRSHESYIEGGKKSSKTQKEKWANMSQEEMDAWCEKMSQCHSTDHYRTLKASQNSKYRLSLTPEEEARQNAMRSKAMKEWWSQFTKEERWTLMNERFEGGAGYHIANSKPNLKFKELLEKYNLEFSREFRLENFSYDFKVGNILIEIDPTATHNSTWSPFGNPVSKTYHREKTECAKRNGYRCIHIFDWDDYEKVVKLLIDRPKVYARKCEVVEIDKNTAVAFLNTNHLQGYAKDDIRLGLQYKNELGDVELVSVMTFDKPRYNKKFDYELIRYCSIYDVVGGAEKLFKYFLYNYVCESVISYCDLSKFDGEIYNRLGFKNVGAKISRHWYNPSIDLHITDNFLRQRGFDQLFGESFGKGSSNDELMLKHNFVEVYDCGQAKFEYSK